jgi:hypothetical protein
MRIYFSEILVLALFHPHFLHDLLGKSSHIQPRLALGPPAGVPKVIFSGWKGRNVPEGLMWLSFVHRNRNRARVMARNFRRAPEEFWTTPFGKSHQYETGKNGPRSYREWRPDTEDFGRARAA